MKKIPNELECPIDNLIIDYIAVPFSEMFKHFNFTPNGITTLSLLFGIISIISLCKGWLLGTVIFMFLSYVMDCVDGYYARKYDMVTKGGDYYDHIKDALVFLVYIVILYRRNRYKLSNMQWLVVLGVLVFFLLSSIAYFACQEKYYDKAIDIPTLGWLQNFVKDKKTAEKCLETLRYFGMGTFIVVVLIFTVWIELRK
jgi:phosphatidylglycerophosphate synthase